MMLNVRGVFFDAGDTLLHIWHPKEKRFEWLCRGAQLQCDLPDDPDVWRRATRENELHYQLGRDAPDFRSAEFWLRGNLRALEALNLEPPASARSQDHWLRDLAQNLGRHARRLQHEGRFFTVDDTTAELLETLRQRNYRLAIVSNWEGDLEHQLQATGILELFDVVADSHWVGSAKPEPEIYHWTLERMGLAPGDVIHVGDSLGTDIHGARAAALAGAVLLDPLSLYEDVSAGLGPGPDVSAFQLYVVDTLEALTTILPPRNGGEAKLCD